MERIIIFLNNFKQLPGHQKKLLQNIWRHITNAFLYTSESCCFILETIIQLIITWIYGTVYRSPSHSLRRIGIGVDHQKRPIRVRPLVALLIEKVDAPVAATTTVDEQPQLVLGGFAQPSSDYLSDVDFLPTAVRFV